MQSPPSGAPRPPPLAPGEGATQRAVPLVRLPLLLQLPLEALPLLRHTRVVVQGRVPRRHAPGRRMAAEVVPRRRVSREPGVANRVAAQGLRLLRGPGRLTVAFLENRGRGGGGGECDMGHGGRAAGRDALEGRGPQRRPQKRLGRRLEEVAEAGGGGYCRLPTPLLPALGVRGTVAGHRLGALEGGGGTTGLHKRGNDTSRSTGRSGRQNAATRLNMRRDDRVTVQGPVKKQQPDGM